MSDVHGFEDTGERRRNGEHRPVITELMDEATIQSIAEDTWIALVGEDEVLVPRPGELPGDVVSSWVDVVGRSSAYRPLKGK